MTGIAFWLQLQYSLPSSHGRQSQILLCQGPLQSCWLYSSIPCMGTDDSQVAMNDRDYQLLAWFHRDRLSLWRYAHYCQMQVKVNGTNGYYLSLTSELQLPGHKYKRFAIRKKLTLSLSQPPKHDYHHKQYNSNYAENHNQSCWYLLFCWCWCYHAWISIGTKIRIAFNPRII